MSWLSGIAGKAEALLDRMDHAAATSIQSAGISTPQRADHHSSLAYEPTASVAIEKSLSVPAKPPTSSLPPHKTSVYSPVTRPEAPPQTTPTPSSYNAYSKSRSNAPNEDSIFQFLNTPTRPSESRKTAHPPGPQRGRRPSSPVEAQRKKSGSMEVEGVGEGGGGEGGEEEEEGRGEGEREGKEDTNNGGEEEAENDVPTPATHTREHSLDSTREQGEGDMGECDREEQSPSSSGDREMEGSPQLVVAVVQSQPTLSGGENDKQSEQKMVSCMLSSSDGDSLPYPSLFSLSHSFTITLTTLLSSLPPPLPSLPHHPLTPSPLSPITLPPSGELTAQGV